MTLSDIEGAKSPIEMIDDISNPAFDFSTLDVFSPSQQKKDLFAENQRKSWDKSIEARCDFSRRVRLSRRAGVWFTSIWHKTVCGRTLSDIKADDSMVEFFAENMAPLISEIIGARLDKGGWALVTTPKRRHKEHNFATRICYRMASMLNIPFTEDMAFANSRQRVNAHFVLNAMPTRQNIIVFDDFVTTGSTFAAMSEILRQHGKNAIYFTGIDNKL